MGKTIWVDDDVYEWLLRQAKAFVDNPNKVLRRVAGFKELPRKPKPKEKKQL